MREIVLDTETTGLDPGVGHRVVEIGCVELVSGMPTGVTFHRYFNPQRPMPEEARQIHGLDDTFLADKPLFADAAEEFLAFVADARLIMHNAAFDLGFLNAELERLERAPLANPFVDTVSVARRRFPGQRASLDALCERFGINNAHRTLHGALLDAQLLGEVYVELSGGRQRGLALVTAEVATEPIGVLAAPQGPRREPRPHQASVAELAAHAAFIAKLKDPVWLIAG
jgi:DNA polymerase-3 subunit epsilon